MDKCTKGVDILRILDFFLNRNVSALSNFPRIRVHTSDAFPPILYIITWHMWQRDRYFWYSLCIVTTHFDKLCILQYLSQLQFLKCVSTLHDLLLLGGGSIHKLEGEVVPSIFALFRGRFGNEGRLQWMVKYSYINRVV